MTIAVRALLDICDAFTRTSSKESTIVAKVITPIMALAVLLGGSTTARATPILQSVTPVATTFTFGVGSDFLLMSGTGLGDVTATLNAVDLLVPPSGGSTSGCEAFDFAGFTVGSIALIQRGTCSFAVKAANAEAAGAVGVLIFNEGNTADRLGAISGTLGSFAASVPVFFTSFDVGNLLSNGNVNGSTGYTVRMSVTQEDLVPVPEPATIALLGLGLVGLVRSRRLGRAR